MCCVNATEDRIILLYLPITVILKLSGDEPETLTSSSKFAFKL